MVGRLQYPPYWVSSKEGTYHLYTGCFYILSYEALLRMPYSTASESS